MTQLVLQGRAVNQANSFGKPLAQEISGRCVYLHLLLIISDGKRQKREIAAGVVFRNMRKQIRIFIFHNLTHSTCIIKGKCDRLDIENSQQQTGWLVLLNNLCFIYAFF